MENEEWITRSRLTIITGHYGCGKTEFAINLALALAAQGKKVALADLDVINPYFRSREQEQMLTEKGIWLVTNSKMCADADVPSMPAELNTVIQDRSYYGIFDIGGDAAGAKVLARYRKQLSQQDYQVLFVLNANRPQMSTLEMARAYLVEIEEASGLSVSGIINNTHMCSETTWDDVCQGARLAEALSKQTGIPLIGHVVERGLISESKLSETVFLADIYMKRPWETETGSANNKKEM